MAREDGHDGVVLGVVDVGGSHLNAATARPTGAHPVLEHQVRADLDSAAGEAVLLDQLTAPLAGLGATAWVVALPGPFDYARGRGDFAAVGKFGALADVDLRAALAARLHVAGDAVHFLNDAVAYGLGEWSADDARPERFLCLTLGTGVGSAFLVDGVPVGSGPGVPPHGWVHLLTVGGGPLEDTVSTRAIVAAYARRTGRVASVRDVAAAARNGDGTAHAVLADAMRALGRALRPCLADFRADALVVGGSVARSWDLLEAPLREGLGDAVPAALLPAALLDDAPLLGAAWWFSRSGRSASPAPTP